MDLIEVHISGKLNTFVQSPQLSPKSITTTQVGWEPFEKPPYVISNQASTGRRWGGFFVRTININFVPRRNGWYPSYMDFFKTSDGISGGGLQSVPLNGKGLGHNLMEYLFWSGGLISKDILIVSLSPKMIDEDSEKGIPANPNCVFSLRIKFLASPSIIAKAHERSSLIRTNDMWLVLLRVITITKHMHNSIRSMKASSANVKIVHMSSFPLLIGKESVLSQFP